MSLQSRWLPFVLFCAAAASHAQDPVGERPPQARDVPYGQWEREDVPLPPEAGLAVERVWIAADGTLHVRTDRATLARGANGWAAVEAGANPEPLRTAGPEALRAVGLEPASVTGEVRDVRTDASGVVWVATDGGLVVAAPERAPARLTGEQGLPVEDLRCLAIDPDAAWLGTARGVVRFDGERWRYFGGRMWLPDDDVRSLCVDHDGSLWVGTGKGLGRVFQRRMTLAQKAEGFQARILARHRRHGMVSGIALGGPGDVTQPIFHDNDNDGLWTSIYLGSQCFRWAVTRDPAAREAARESFEAMAVLATVSGIPGFPARSVVKPDEPHGGGEWHPSADGKWIWKGDTSSDEVVGHFFGFSLYYDLVADGVEKDRIRAIVDAMAGHIVDHGFNLIDVDGKPTSWGRWGPDYTRSLQGYFARGLQALEVLSHLRVALHVTGNPRYAEAYDRLVKKHGYARMTVGQKIQLPRVTNHSDDELAFLSYYPLFRHETDAEMRAIFLRSLTRSWRIEKPERSPLFNFIAGAARGAKGDPDLDASLDTLRDTPMETIGWGVDHRHRKDVKVSAILGRTGRPVIDRVLPISERSVQKWNHDPYMAIDGGGGTGEDDGSFWLLPYWMGRYHGLIGPPEE